MFWLYRHLLAMEALSSKHSANSREFEKIWPLQCEIKIIGILHNNSSFKGTIQDHEKLSEFASEFGSYCQFDLFGIENSYYQIKSTIDFPSDAQRIAMIQSLIVDKFEDKILMAHDIHTKHRLVKILISNHYKKNLRY